MLQYKLQQKCKSSPRDLHLKEAYVRPSAQLFAEIDDIWEKRLDDFEKFATVDPLHLTESVEVKLVASQLVKLMMMVVIVNLYYN